MRNEIYCFTKFTPNHRSLTLSFTPTNIEEGWESYSHAEGGGGGVQNVMRFYPLKVFVCRGWGVESYTLSRLEGGTIKFQTPKYPN